MNQSTQQLIDIATNSQLKREFHHNPVKAKAKTSSKGEKLSNKAIIIAHSVGSKNKAIIIAHSAGA